MKGEKLLSNMKVKQTNRSWVGELMMVGGFVLLIAGAVGIVVIGGFMTMGIWMLVPVGIVAWFLIAFWLMTS